MPYWHTVVLKKRHAISKRRLSLKTFSYKVQKSSSDFTLNLLIYLERNFKNKSIYIRLKLLAPSYLLKEYYIKIIQPGN